jgi:hypothetical protein
MGKPFKMHLKIYLIFTKSFHFYANSWAVHQLEIENLE